MMLNFGIERMLANHVSVAYLVYMGEPPLGHRSKVIIGTDLKFSGRCKIVQWLGIPSFVTIGRSVREIFSENPRGVASTPPPCVGEGF